MCLQAKQAPPHGMCLETGFCYPLLAVSMYHRLLLSICCRSPAALCQQPITVTVCSTVSRKHAVAVAHDMSCMNDTAASCPRNTCKWQGSIEALQPDRLNQREASLWGAGATGALLSYGTTQLLADRTMASAIGNASRRAIAAGTPALHLHSHALHHHVQQNSSNNIGQAARNKARPHHVQQNS